MLLVRLQRARRCKSELLPIHEFMATVQKAGKHVGISNAGDTADRYLPHITQVSYIMQIIPFVSSIQKYHLKNPLNHTQH